MIKQRDEKRVLFRKLVVCKANGQVHPGFSQDVSQHGIGLQITQLPPLHRRVRIALAVEEKTIFLDGEVRWAIEYTGALAAKPHEVGIHIPKPPGDYLQLVADCCDRAPSRPAGEPLK